MRPLKPQQTALENCVAYVADEADLYIASLKRRGIRGWQEARKLRTFRAAYRHAIAQVQDTAFQLGRTESERDEAVALLRAAKDNDFTCPDDQEVDAFLTRIGGTE